jgi:hypothetical protein
LTGTLLNEWVKDMVVINNYVKSEKAAKGVERNILHAAQPIGYR